MYVQYIQNDTRIGDILDGEESGSIDATKLQKL